MPEWLPVATAITLVGALVGIGIWIGGVNADRKRLQGFGEWKGKVDSERRSFKEFMQEVRNDIKTILSRLPAPEATGASPLRLTAFGKELSDGISGVQWAARIADAVADQVVGMEAYEIQEFSFAYVKNDLNPSEAEQRAIRRTAYEQSARIEQIHRVLAIELRDKLLARASLKAPD